MVAGMINQDEDILEESRFLTSVTGVLPTEAEFGVTD